VKVFGVFDKSGLPLREDVGVGVVLVVLLVGAVGVVACLSPRGTLKSGQSGTPEKRPVVSG